MRQTYVYDPVSKELVKKEEYRRAESAGPMIMADIAPYQSMVTGEMIGSRSTHRDHLRRHGLIEVGNEMKHLKNKPLESPPGLRRTLSEIAYAKLRN